MQSLISYYTTVLGITGVIGAAQVSKKPILFVAITQNNRPSLNDKNEASALFNKMLSAIGLKRESIELLENSNVSNDDFEVWTQRYSSVVVLDGPQKNATEIRNNVLWTIHPQELLLNSSLKKVAWEHLKKLSSGALNG